MTQISPPAPPSFIVVMGVSGSGKSSLAELLAGQLGYIYLDADDFHTVAARERMASGLPLTDTMRTPWTTCICNHVQQLLSTGKRCILAFSGLRKAHRQQLRSANLQPVFLFLHGDKNVIQERLEARTGHFMPSVLLDSQFSSLECPREEQDVIELNISLALDQLAQEAIGLLCQEPLVATAPVP